MQIDWRNREENLRNALHVCTAEEIARSIDHTLIDVEVSRVILLLIEYQNGGTSNGEV